MDREKLKTSLDHLTPSSEQRQRMLRNIRTQAPAKKRFSYLKLGVAMAALFGVFFLFTEALPLLKGDGPAPMAAQAPAEDQAIAESSGMLGSEARSQGVDYAFLLQHTPWQSEQTPASLPVFTRVEASKSALATKVENFRGEGFTYSVPEVSGYEARIVSFLVHFSIRYDDGTAQEALPYEAVRSVRVKSYAEALKELTLGNNSAGQAFDVSSVNSGQLLYVEQGEELLPVYRFQVQDALIDVEAIK